MRPDRSMFLRPPDAQGDGPMPPETARILRDARGPLRKALAGMTGRWGDECSRRETENSAAIEGEFQPARIDLHHTGLSRYLGEPCGRDSMLRLHARVMQDQPHAQPGRYRTTWVRIGRHAAPPPWDVPELMEALWSYVDEASLDPIVQAAWAHIVFETIHPFSDGNGRTGRALISRILGGPLPLSRYILEERQTYYRLLDCGDGREWLAWFARGVQRESERTLQEMEGQGER